MYSGLCKTNLVLVGSKCTILGFTWRLQLLNLEPLETRRLKYDLKMYFKIIHNLINIDPSKYFQFTPADSKTRGYEYKLRKQVYGSSQFFNSFSNRAVDCWNSLPNELVSSGSFAAFSRALKEMELTKFIKGMPSEM